VKRKARGRPPIRRDAGSGVISGEGLRRAGAAGSGDASVGVREGLGSSLGIFTPPVFEAVYTFAYSHSRAGSRVRH